MKWCVWVDVLNGIGIIAPIRLPWNDDVDVGVDGGGTGGGADDDDAQNVINRWNGSRSIDKM